MQVIAKTIKRGPDHPTLPFPSSFLCCPQLLLAVNQQLLCVWDVTKVSPAWVNLITLPEKRIACFIMMCFFYSHHFSVEDVKLKKNTLYLKQNLENLDNFSILGLGLTFHSTLLPLQINLIIATNSIAMSEQSYRLIVRLWDILYEA